MSLTGRSEKSPKSEFIPEIAADQRLLRIPDLSSRNSRNGKLPVQISSSTGEIELVIFDLNGVLVDYTFDNGKYSGYEIRLPEIKMVLDFQTRGYRIAIWTATKRKIALPIIAELIELGLRPEFGKFREDCIFRNCRPTKPILEYGNTAIIVDDSLGKISMNPNYFVWWGRRKRQRLMRRCGIFC